ncbi:hypothetical protein MPTK1_4g11600 [Marchantia polymorpha subsp. ruderalis]|uniref:Uncharacterized protein n=2 Tax=Marchantia polymorpha TaxID=3197 RepID=A0A176WDU3_MARPO|nr:hypothetical protein AXG93_1962s1060 [Marchantia polymorpha subsp. ruderalis]PTQ46476.1 hypothetical protein MARPO_0011s0145 [Marchantia polymorpha]BBN08440.1 hypothetical protein Mp_4g11600 [Marchantia polymorpha subsp. ruderalis]|eukprot:PTQ46476.1 hypothetical protein MARPO_0011s0145 [Marchantia polymorpha]
MAVVSVQLVSKAASEKLSMKYSDLSEPPEVIGPEPKRLSLQSFLHSHFANSPRRTSMDEFTDASHTFDSRRLSTTGDSRRASAEYYPNLKQEAFVISVTPLNTEKVGPNFLLRSSPAPSTFSAPSTLIKKAASGLPANLTKPRPKNYEHLSLKYKLLYLCGVSNIDMVDNYVSIPR